MDSPPPHPSDAGWLHQLGPRLRRLWLPKMIGTTLGMTGFFFAYFWLLRHPQFPVTTMPLVALDRMIAFRPEAMSLYVSLWVYVSLAPALLLERRELVSYGVAAAVLSVIGLGIFFFWPTAVPIPAIDWSQHPKFVFLKTIDAAGNACPSLHVAFAIFTAVWFERLLRQMKAGGFVRAFNWLWCLGILYSTMATRQHVALDVLAGTALGLVVAAAHLHFLKATASPARA